LSQQLRLELETTIAGLELLARGQPDRGLATGLVKLLINSSADPDSVKPRSPSVLPRW
jgi:hypothetical protein